MTPRYLPRAFVCFTSLALSSACEPPTEESHDHEQMPEEESPDESTRLRARVWQKSPTDGSLTEVTLVEPTAADGALTGEFVNALNCVNEDGGANLFGFATLCVEKKTVLPDEDGSYLNIEPPADEGDQQDPFAELMMYHHVNQSHAYFRGEHGFEGLDFPLDAVVNVSFKVQGQWQSFPNAAFIPAESFGAFGLPARDFGAIMFGQGDPVDFSYDASVILHEYSHAMVGTGRLQGAFLDGQGLNNTPGAINEAIADYFAATELDDPLIGPYALESFARNLEVKKTCPENLTTEIHADGEIVGAALWSMRAAIGKTFADQAVFQAVQASSVATGFEEFGALVLDAASRLSPENGTVVESILQEHGLLSCERVKTWADTDFVAESGLPLTVEGRQSAMGAFTGGVPAYLQLRVPAQSSSFVQLEWQQSAGGGFFGGAPSPLALAVRRGQAVEVSAIGAVTADDVVERPFATGTTQRVVLEGACLSTDLYTSFVNRADAPASVERIRLVPLDAAPDGVDVVSCP